MASSPITSWQTDVGTVANFILGGSKITEDGDCSHEIKRHSLLGRKAMTNLDSILKSRGITLPTKVHLVKAIEEGNGSPLQYSCLEKSHGWRRLVGCSPWGLYESDTTEQLHFHFSLSCTGEGNGNPLQCSCLENPRDRGAWWAAVYGVDWSDLAAAAAVKAMFFSSSHVWMWELDYKESWGQKIRCFSTVVLGRTVESPLDCKKMKPVNPKENQFWIFFGRTDAETSILWPPDVKNWLIWKDPDVGKGWRQ